MVRGDWSEGGQQLLSHVAHCWTRQCVRWLRRMGHHSLQLGDHRWLWSLAARALHILDFHIPLGGPDALWQVSVDTAKVGAFTLGSQPSNFVGKRHPRWTIYHILYRQAVHYRLLHFRDKLADLAAGFWTGHGMTTGIVWWDVFGPSDMVTATDWEEGCHVSAGRELAS